MITGITYNVNPVSVDRDEDRSEFVDAFENEVHANHPECAVFVTFEDGRSGLTGLTSDDSGDTIEKYRNDFAHYGEVAWRVVNYNHPRCRGTHCIKVTRPLMKKIRAAVLDRVGRFRLEVGERHWDSPNGEECYGFNMLLWGPGHTLWGTCDWQSFQGREIDTLAGWIALDIYCYRISNPGSGEHEGELYGNAYVLISPAGEVAYCSEDDLGYAQAMQDILATRGVKRTLAESKRAGT